MLHHVTTDTVNYIAARLYKEKSSFGSGYKAQCAIGCKKQTLFRSLAVVGTLGHVILEKIMAKKSETFFVTKIEKMKNMKEDMSRVREYMKKVEFIFWFLDGWCG